MKLKKPDPSPPYQAHEAAKALPLSRFGSAGKTLAAVKRLRKRKA